MTRKTVCLNCLSLGAVATASFLLLGLAAPAAIDTEPSLGGSLALPPTANGNTIEINEVRIDQPGADNDEYFELRGDPDTSLDGLTYIVIGDGTGGSGVIDGVVDLTGQTIGASGFFVAAEATFTLGVADMVTTLPFENGDNVTHMLVLEFTGAPGDDLDTDDDCVLDVTPWTSIVDLIALIEEENPPGGTECHYGPPTVGPDGTFVPGHAYQCTPDDTWTIGAFDPAGGDDTPGAPNAPCAGDVCGLPESGNCFEDNGSPGCDDETCCNLVCDLDPSCCDIEWDQTCADLANILCEGGEPCGVPGAGNCFEANGTPGCDDAECCNAVCDQEPFCCDVEWDQSCADIAAELCVTGGEPPDVVINEIRIDQPSTDTDEYFELVADPDTSLDGVSYIVIGDGAGASGVIDGVVDLTGQTVGASGFFVAAEDTFTLGVADMVTTLPFENGDNVTHMLVFNFTGAPGDDLDTDDDCVLDLEPWEAEIDRIALIEEDNPPEGTECHYGPPTVGPDDIFVPGHVYRCTPEGDWTIGAFDPDGGDDTPGAANPPCETPCPADLDGSGTVDSADLALLLGAWGPC